MRDAVIARTHERCQSAATDTATAKCPRSDAPIYWFTRSYAPSGQKPPPLGYMVSTDQTPSPVSERDVVCC